MGSLAQSLWILHVLCAAAYLSMAVFITARRPGALLNRACAAIVVCFFVWSSCLAVSHHPDVSKQTAALFYSVGSFAWASFASIAVAFIVAFLEPARLKSWAFRAALVVPPAIVIYGQWTGHVAADYVKRPWGHAYVWQDSAFSYFFYGYYNVYMLTGLSLLLRASFRAKDPIRRKQARLISSWAYVPLLLSSLTDVVLPRAGIYDVPNMAPDFTMIWVVALVYSIAKVGMLELTPRYASDRIVATMTEAVLLVDPQDRIVWSNPAASTLLGYDEGALRSMALGDLFPASVREEQRASTTDGAARDVRLVDKGGRERIVSFSSSEMRDPEGELVGRVCVAADITDRKAAEDALRAAHDELETRVAARTQELSRANDNLEIEMWAHKRSEERYRSLVDNMQEGLCLIDAGDRITFVNSRLATLLGYQAQDLVGSRLVDFATQPGGTSSEPALKDARKGAPVRVDWDLRRKDGSLVSTMAQIGPLPQESGGYAGAVITVIDVTERKRMQAQLARSDRMASLGLLAAGVGHEINNPLTYVLDNLQELHDSLAPSNGESAAPKETGGPDRERFDAALSEALEGAQRIREIVADLRNFTRVEHKVASVDVNRVVDAAARLAQHAIKFRARLVVEHGDVPRVRVNERRLAQVFSNLLVNAAHAMGDDRADQNVIRVRVWSDRGEVCVSTTDTGKGIAPEHLEQIFDPFFSTKEAGEGVGLGLAICHEIVSSYGGTIRAESTLGKGTSFIVRLPAEQPQAAPRASSLPPPPKAVTFDGKRARILVIDDEPNLCGVLRRLLGRHHEVTTTGSAEDARDLLGKDADFDVVLCDVMMPGMSGMAFHEWLAAERPGLAARLVFMTGGVLSADAREGLDATANPILEKPFAPGQVVRATNEVIERCGLLHPR